MGMNITATKALLGAGATIATGAAVNRGVDAARKHDDLHGTSREKIIGQALFAPVATGLTVGFIGMLVAQTPKGGVLSALSFGAAAGALSGAVLLDAGRGWNSPAAAG